MSEYLWYIGALMAIAQQLAQKGIQPGRSQRKQTGSCPNHAQDGIDRSTVMKMTGLTENDLAHIRH